MKTQYIFTLLLLSSLSVLSSARRPMPQDRTNPIVFSMRRLIPEDIQRPQNLERGNRNTGSLLRDPISPDNQSPLVDMPSESIHDAGNPEQGGVRVSDILGKTREVNFFAGLTRDDKDISNRLNNDAENTIVLAPNNQAIQRLPRKPWENPDEYDAFGGEAYAGSNGQKRASRNLERFVLAHLVPQSSWAANEEVKTLGGAKIYWEEGKDGNKYIQPGNVKVEKVVSRVANGEVWVLDGVINYL
ncbi:hypothetical protein FQN57_005465 [Myotisia sp. PD_48]|nr:hypothetical protein FQN57_005465 [Myotisia sp. PD_48]